MKSLFKTISGVKNHCNRDERLYSTSNTTKTSGNYNQQSRLRGSVEEKLLREDIKDWRILAKLA